MSELMSEPQWEDKAPRAARGWNFRAPHYPVSYEVTFCVIIKVL